MISKIELRDFKCFSELSLDIGGLTLLTGFNAAGKSTVIQAVLTCSQTFKGKVVEPEIQVNGHLVTLGAPADIINDSSGSNSTDVAICSEDESYCFKMSSQSGLESQLLINRLEIHGAQCTHVVEGSEEICRAIQDMSGPSAAKNMPLAGSIIDIIYISAIRDGALEIYHSPSRQGLTHADVGVKGEYAAWWFSNFLDEDISPERCHQSESSPVLRRQLNAWASSIFPGVEANATKISGTNFVKLEFRSGVTDKWRKPSNIGYGLTYIFSILVACLLAKKGQVVIIDSPEAHLHPLGQSRIGLFLSKIAQSGVQIIIETHSDHILNGVRIAAKQNVIQCENILLHFFQGGRQARGEPPTIVTSLVSSDGSLSDWPDGFFDQAEKDLAELAGWTNETVDS